MGLAACSIVISAWLFMLYPAERGPGRGRVVQVVVPRNPRTSELASMLAAAGLVSNPRLFMLWV
ncbi:MAG: hypothetical protein M3O46_03955, partial [Myxococcota bacterium]|nr:hypothetical protein [Myxococcota bacterium]